jgi:hypothetical protein
MCLSTAPAVWKPADAAQEEVFLVASVATPEQPVSLPHYCEKIFHPDASYGAEEVIV